MSRWKKLRHTERERERLIDAGRILLAAQVHHWGQGMDWDVHCVVLDEDTGEPVEDTGWRLEDYTHWAACPKLPPLPEPPNTEPTP